MATQTQLLLLQKTMVVVEGVARKLYPETNIWNVSRPILENWLESLKGPKATISRAVDTSGEILKRIPDLPEFMDKANYALQLIAEGKLNLTNTNNTSLEVEKLKIRSFRNNVLISILGVIILTLVVF
jgi:ubiquinone biosynthesis protein